MSNKKTNHSKVRSLSTRQKLKPSKSNLKPNFKTCRNG